eukprot:2538808-Pyramimonas_sp.AAC.1
MPAEYLFDAQHAGELSEGAGFPGQAVRLAHPDKVANSEARQLAALDRCGKVWNSDLQREVNITKIQQVKGEGHSRLEAASRRARECRRPRRPRQPPPLPTHRG